MTAKRQPRKDFEVDALSALGGLTISVKYTNLWRMRLGMALLSLAARVLRCGVVVNGCEFAEEGAQQ